MFSITSLFSTFSPQTLPRVVLLHRAQLHSDNQLGLGGHVLEDVGLQPPQHVGPQQVVELLDLVLLGDVGELLQEALQVTGGRIKQLNQATANTASFSNLVLFTVRGSIQFKSFIQASTVFVNQSKEGYISRTS